MTCCAWIRRKARGARTLSVRDWLTLPQAWVGLLVVDVALRTLPFSRVRDAAAGKAAARPGAARGGVGSDVVRLHRLVNLAARAHVVPMRCLRRALVLQWLLARRGIAAELRLGVNKDADTLNAHAWVEIDGTPVGERPSVTEQFAPLQAVQVHP